MRPALQPHKIMPIGDYLLLLMCRRSLAAGRRSARSGALGWAVAAGLFRRQVCRQRGKGRAFGGGQVDWASQDRRLDWAARRPGCQIRPSGCWCVAWLRSALAAWPRVRCVSGLASPGTLRCWAAVLLARPGAVIRLPAGPGRRWWLPGHGRRVRSRRCARWRRRPMCAEGRSRALWAFSPARPSPPSCPPGCHRAGRSCASARRRRGWPTATGCSTGRTASRRAAWRTRPG